MDPASQSAGVYGRARRERDPASVSPVAVLDDVLDGYLTVGQARADHGVVIRVDLSVDEAATRAARPNES